MLDTGSRGGNYSCFVDFSTHELMSNLSIYLLPGISPSPQIEIKFKSEKEDPVIGSIQPL